MRRRRAPCHVARLLSLVALACAWSAAPAAAGAADHAHASATSDSSRATWQGARRRRIDDNDSTTDYTDFTDRLRVDMRFEPRIRVIRVIRGERRASFWAKPSQDATRET